MFGRLVKIALVGVAVVLLIQGIPDIKRFVAMHRM
jgi:Family of unknown function (DUF6893)